MGRRLRFGEHVLDFASGELRFEEDGWLRMLATIRGYAVETLTPDELRQARLGLGCGP